ncbi:protein of unknown function [Cyanobium sp. NIES-981]|nr:protein of unknown function [Cyanobium sp. NIES-981]
MIHRSPLLQRFPEFPRETDLFPRRTQSWRGSRPHSSDSWCHSVFFEPFADRSHSTLVCIGRWVGSVEDLDIAKQNDRDPAACPLTYLPAKLLKQGFDVPPRQAAAYRPGEDQLKGALVLPLHPIMVLLPSTRRSLVSTACWIRITLKISGGNRRCS